MRAHPGCTCVAGRCAGTGAEWWRTGAAASGTLRKAALAWAVLAAQGSSWSPRRHPCFPPAFKAAVRELLRISHKLGGCTRAGRLAWAFDRNLLVDLLLPLLGRSPADWL